MPNENILSGLSCPNCGSQEPFTIEINTAILFNDDGEDDSQSGSDQEWEDWSLCACRECGYTGQLLDFKETHREKLAEWPGGASWKDIRFPYDEERPHRTTSEGRNGLFRTTGVTVWASPRELGACTIQGITSRGMPGRGDVTLPLDKIPELVRALLQAHAEATCAERLGKLHKVEHA